MRAIKFLLTLITLVMVFSTCSENDNVEPGPITTDIEHESLSDEQAAFLEAVKDTVFRLEDIILEDGQNVRAFLETNDPDFLMAYPSGRVGKTKALNPREQKKMYLSRMLAFGTFLVDRTKHVYPVDGNDGPFQFGLAYSWGSRDYDKRQRPPVEEVEGCNDLKIYGLDCSGMIWAMTKASSLPPVVPKEKFRVMEISDADKWTKAFKASDDYKDLKMKNMGQLKQDKMKNGDLILWGGHVGIYLNGYFYQSNGSKLLPKCKNNLSLSKGPRLVTLTEVLNWEGLGSYKVFRIIIDLKFNFVIKYYSSTLISGGLLDATFVMKDSASMTVVVKDEKVTCSNFINSPGEIIPTTKTDAFACKSTWLPDNFMGPLTITSGEGVYDFATSGERLRLTLLGTGQNPAFTVVCPEMDQQSIPGESGPLFFPFIDFKNLDDTVPVYFNDPGGSITAKLTPVD